MYGHHVKKTYGPANLSQLIAAEMEEKVPAEKQEKVPAGMQEKIPAGETNARQHGSSHEADYSSGHTASVYSIGTDNDEETLVSTPNSKAFNVKESTGTSQQKEREKGRILISGKMPLCNDALLFADIFQYRRMPYSGTKFVTWAVTSSRMTLT